MIKQIHIHWPGHDEIMFDFDTESNLVTRLRVIGCAETMIKLKTLKENYAGRSVLDWPVPNGTSHSEMLIRELLLKVQNKWVYPFQEQQLCQCREVPTSDVDQAILSGAHTIHQVTMATGAASACSSCSIHIERILDYRLKGASNSNQ